MTRTIIMLSASLLFSMSSFAQDDRLYKPFKVDMGVTLTVPFDDNFGVGGGFYVEPKYAASDQLNFGIRMGVDALTEGNINIGVGDITFGTTTIGQIHFTSDYYFNKDRTRPFIGLGMGMYRRSEYNVGIASFIPDIEVGKQTNFGVAPRVGLNAGHFMFAAVMNFTGSEIPNYFGLNFGAVIGGGPIKK